jgi:hypothetical protein
MVKKRVAISICGHDAMLKANHDVNIIGQENTIKTKMK